MSNYINNLPPNFLVLAPMEDVTDTVFRRMIQRIAPFDLYMTEFVNVDGLQSPGRDIVGRRLRFTNEEQPLIAQIWGSNPDNYYKTALELVEMGFAGIDINMGCPVKAVVKNGCGGGMIDRPEAAVEVIKAVQEAVKGKIPVSVKTRIGTREFTPEWIKTILEQELAMFTIHLRTIKEMSLVPAHWDLMPQIKQIRDEVSPNTKLVGNGDIMNRQHANQLIEKYGIDGAMIGRGIFQDPLASLVDSNWAGIDKKDKLALYRQHVELFKETWGDDGKPVAPLNKFCKTYVSGFDGAKELRESLMQAKSVSDLLDVIKAAELKANQ